MCSAVAGTASTCPSRLQGHVGMEMENLAWPACLFLLQLFSMPIALVQTGEGAAPSGRMGDAQSCDVGTICPPETMVPFTLMYCDSSKRKHKSVLANDTSHSLLILSSFSFLSSSLPLSSPTVLQSIK